MRNNMTKDDLRSGMQVTTANGKRYLVVKQDGSKEFILYGVGDNTYLDGANYNDDLTHINPALAIQFDIISVAELFNFHKNSTAELKLNTIWKRPAPKKVVPEDNTTDSITINRVGRTINARWIDSNGRVKTCTVKRHPEDTNDLEYAVGLVFDRLFNNSLF